MTQKLLVPAPKEKKKCFCGHPAKNHGEFTGGVNRKGYVSVCSRDNCHYWNLCDIGPRYKIVNGKATKELETEPWKGWTNEQN